MSLEFADATVYHPNLLMAMSRALSGDGADTSLASANLDYRGVVGPPEEGVSTPAEEIVLSVSA